MSENTGHAIGLSGSAQGGGISDVDLSGIGQSPGGRLILTNSRVVLNRLSGSPAITRSKAEASPPPTTPSPCPTA